MVSKNLEAPRGEVANDADIKILNIESIRIAASDQIRTIDEQLKQLKQFDGNSEFIMFWSNHSELAAQGLPQQLDEIDTLGAFKQNTPIRMIPFED